MSDFTRLERFVRESPHRRLAASDAEAFARICLETFLGLSDTDIARALTFGDHDGGVAALHIALPGETGEGAHIVFCDWVAKERDSKRVIKERSLRQFGETWLAIASSRDDDVQLNERLRQQIQRLKSYWAQCDSGHIPHTFYFFTNRQEAGIPRTRTEHQLNYYMMHTYRYFEQEELAEALLGD